MSSHLRINTPNYFTFSLFFFFFFSIWMAFFFFFFFFFLFFCHWDDYLFFYFIISPIQFFSTVYGDPVTRTCIHSFFSHYHAPSQVTRHSSLRLSHPNKHILCALGQSIYYIFRWKSKQ